MKIPVLKKNTARACVFGYPVDIALSKDFVNFAINCMQNARGIHIVTINPEIIATADKNPEFANIIKQAELIIPDSSGIILALKSMGFFNAEKVAGIEFSEKLIGKCTEKGLKIAFLGGSEEVINLLNIRLKKMFPGINIVFSCNGYFKDSNNIVNQLKKFEPHLLFVALGSPKQEFFIKHNKNILDKTVMIGVGGSFDVWAKKVKRAPVLFRNFGLEWLYRLINQPTRFNRMFPVLPIFLFRIVFDRRKLKKEYEYEYD